MTPYSEADLLAARFPLVSVSGGKSPEAIAAWMLGKPFAREFH